MIILFIDARLLDLNNILGVMYSILGLLFLTYELFDRNNNFRRALRVITPIFLGILILTPIGILTFAIYSGPLFNGAIEYGLIGALIGAFNGIFVQWPLPKERPSLFSWPCGLIGLILAAFAWLFISLLFNRSLVDALEIAGILSLVGGITGGFWSFLSWEPPPPPYSYEEKWDLDNPLGFLSWEPPPFPETSPAPLWKAFFGKKGLIGLVVGLVLGFMLSYDLGSTPVHSLLTGILLSLSGGIALGFSRFPPPWWSFISWRSFTPSWSSISQWLSASWRSFASSTTAATGADPCVNRPPLFSIGGCVLGLWTALLLGLFSSLAVEIAFGNPLVTSLRATLNGVAIIMPAGAITGGFSRYIFWWAECFDHQSFLGWGFSITLFGILFQLTQPLLDFIGIQPK